MQRKAKSGLPPPVPRRAVGTSLSTGRQELGVNRHSLSSSTSSLSSNYSERTTGSYDIRASGEVQPSTLAALQGKPCEQVSGTLSPPSNPPTPNSPTPNSPTPNSPLHRNATVSSEALTKISTTNSACRYVCACVCVLEGREGGGGGSDMTVVTFDCFLWQRQVCRVVARTPLTQAE